MNGMRPPGPRPTIPNVMLSNDNPAAWASIATGLGAEAFSPRTPFKTLLQVKVVNNHHVKVSVSAPYLLPVATPGICGSLLRVQHQLLHTKKSNHKHVQTLPASLPGSKEWLGCWYLNSLRPLNQVSPGSGKQQ